MIPRTIEKELLAWKEKKNRKPLVLRGARQVGKTTVVDIFSLQFENYIYLNLDLKEDRELFEKAYSFEQMIQALFFQKNTQRDSGTTLIFIDEIQNVPKAVALLRYFYEKTPDLYVIAAGSMLESVIDLKVSFPVGRVEYLILRPLSFKEFLVALEESQAVEILSRVPIPEFAHDKLLKLFHEYALIGGMPEIVTSYAQWKDPVKLKDIYENLITSYLDDVEKYARSSKQANVIRHVIRSVFYEAGKRIKFHGFGQSNYSSREVGDALRALEKALIVQLVYPTTDTMLPLIPNKKKSPKLQFFDTGLVNYFAGFQKEILGSLDLNAVHQGSVAELIVGQELLSSSFSPLSTINFWVREKKQSNAEVDFLINRDSMLIPVEVKSGKTGRLRSLHQFVDRTSHEYAVRFYSNTIQVDQANTIKGKPFYLLNLPYYLAGELERNVDWLLKSACKDQKL
jgi:uncharacterized protein